MSNKVVVVGGCPEGSLKVRRDDARPPWKGMLLSVCLGQGRPISIMTLTSLCKYVWVANEEDVQGRVQHALI